MNIEYIFIIGLVSFIVQCLFIVFSPILFERTKK